MGKERKSRRHSSPSPSESSSSSSYSISDSESYERRRRRRRSRRSSSRHGASSRSKHRASKQKDEEEKRERSRKSKDRRRDKNRTRRRDDGTDSDDSPKKPELHVCAILERFPGVSGDLKQLLQMIDNGQGVDIKGISDSSLRKLLKKLFWSLSLEQNESGAFLLPNKGVPTLEVIGSTLVSFLRPKDDNLPNSESAKEQQVLPSDVQCADDEGSARLASAPEGQSSSAPPRRRLIGPEMPSREVLAAAAELTEAETLLREAEVEVDNDLFIGPPPPAIVSEVESANEAERFEEVARIAGADIDKPYDILGVNWKMSFDNIKKRYWKLSLMVHPDKCSHPQAHQAFVTLNQAFKHLQDPDKRKAIDEKIKLKEEQEQLEVELKELREAARWRQMQGISLEGDDELLAATQEVPKRDEWMTELPPERKPRMPVQSTSFSRTTKEGRGDTSVWTDHPGDKAEKAKLHYLEAYNKTKALADMDIEKKRKASNADLVDKYNASKRSVSLMQQHEEKSKKPKQKSKKTEKEEWEGQHPWKPWNRETDLEAGRKRVNYDSENMAQGLSSRFSSGATQRNFL